MKESTAGPAIDASVLDTLRLVLGELSMRYGVQVHEDAPTVGPALESPDAVHQLLAPEMSALVQEQLRVLLLNAKYQVIGQRVIAQGTLDTVGFTPADVLRPAVVDGAVAVIVAHNHPSGDPTPSPEDIATTRKTAEASRILGVELLDHVVIGHEGRFVSLQTAGLGF